MPAQLKLADDCGLIGVSQPINHDALEERREVRTTISPRRVDLHHAVLGVLHARNVGDKKCFVLTTIKMSPRASAKLNENLDGQRHVVYGDLRNEPGCVYAQKYAVYIIKKVIVIGFFSISSVL